MHFYAVNKRWHQFIDLQSVRLLQKNLKERYNIFKLVVEERSRLYLIDALQNFAEDWLNLRGKRNEELL